MYHTGKTNNKKNTQSDYSGFNQNRESSIITKELNEFRKTVFKTKENKL